MVGFIIVLLAGLFLVFGGIALVRLGVSIVGGCVKYCVPLALFALVLLIGLASV